MRKPMLFVALWMFIPFAGAQTVSFFSIGYGANHCGDYTAAMKLSPANMAINTSTGQYRAESSLYVNWVSGYLTRTNIDRALGREKGRQINLSQNTISAWLENYCSVHPLETIGEAAAELMRKQQ